MLKHVSSCQSANVLFILNKNYVKVKHSGHDILNRGITNILRIYNCKGIAS